MHRFVCFTLFMALTGVVAADTVKTLGFQDDFSKAKLNNRQALRGEWKFENKTASCVADPELYKKFKNHGPILRWPAEFTDGTLEFEFKPQKCQRLVITLNEKGHVFRMSFQDKNPSRFFGWIGESSKTNKAKPVAQKGVPALKQLDGKWIKAKIVFEGDTAQVVYGDYKSKLTHQSIGRKKGEFTISFAEGQLSVRNVRLKISDKKSK